MFKLLAGLIMIWAMSDVGSADEVSFAIAIALIGAGLDTIAYSNNK